MNCDTGNMARVQSCPLPPQAQVFQPTLWLRWRTVSITNSKHSVRVLEQLWMCDGEKEWREVPTVPEE